MSEDTFDPENPEFVEPDIPLMGDDTDAEVIECEGD